MTRLTNLFISSVFIYTMPGYNCSIKERMLYSSCKASLIDRLESQLGLEITKKVSIERIFSRF